MPQGISYIKHKISESKISEEFRNYIFHLKLRLPLNKEEVLSKAQKIYLCKNKCQPRG